MSNISTHLLIKLLFVNREKTIEASINDGIFNATHFLNLGKRKLFDCGIDSVEMSWNIEEFLKFYSKAIWKIDQIV